MMNRYQGQLVTAIMLAALSFCGGVTSAGMLAADHYYTWGIDGASLEIPEGSTITEAVLTIKNITNWDNQLNLHLVDNPPLDFVANTDHGEGDFFQDFGGLLSGYSYDLVDGDLVIVLSQIDDENSWVRQIYDWPFDFQLADGSTIRYSSALLELIDYAGNGTPFGIGLDGEGADYCFSSMELQLTVSAYETPAAEQTLAFACTPEVSYEEPGFVLQFDGVDDTMVWSWGGQAPANAFTMSAWIKAETPTSLPIENNSSSINGWDTNANHLLFPLNGQVGLAAGTNGIVVYERELGYFPALAVYAGNLGTGWNHVTVTYSNKQPRIYLNGLLVHTGLASTRTVDSRPARYLGGHESSGVGNFKGCVSNLQVWSRPLSAQDVLACASGILGTEGLVGDWKLNEGAGSTAFDSSGNELHGAIYGAVWVGDVQKVTDELAALYFDGEDDTVIWSWGDIAPVSDFTMSAWVKPEMPTALPVENATSSGDGWSANARYLFFPLNGEVGMAVGTNGIVVYERQLGYFPALAVYAGNLGTGWNHVAVAYQGKQPRIYLNGTLVHVGLTSTRAESFRPARYLGGHGSASVGNFKGSVYDVQVWDRALSADDVAACQNGALASTGLVGNWKLNEGAGSKAFDSSGNGLHADIFGAAWIGEFQDETQELVALQFNGVDDTVTWSWLDKAPVNSFTMSAWIKAETPTALPTQNATSSSNGWDINAKHLFFPLNGQIGLAAGTNGIVVYERELAHFPALAVYAGNLGTGWNHVAVTYEGTQPHIYLNGTLVHAGLTSQRSENYGPARYLGGHESLNVGNFKGRVCDVQVWNRALSQEDVLACSNGALATTGLAGTWKLNEATGLVAFDGSGNGLHGTINGASWVSEPLE